MTQLQMAIELGVSETAVRNWENNREGIDMFRRVARVCKLLNCSVFDIAED